MMAANLALIRNALLAIAPEHLNTRTLPELRASLHSRSSGCCSKPVTALSS
jgi:hypothetical protein